MTSKFTPLTSKFTPLIIALVAVLSIGLIRTVSEVSRQSKQEQEPHKNRIQWNIDQAKADRRTKVIIEAPTVEYLGSAPRDIEDVLANSTVVLAVPVETRTSETDTGLLTWYKFRPVEYLTDIRTPSCLACNTLQPPSDIPLGSGEFLLPKQGGTINREGVEITEVERSFPSLTLGQPYMMFISLYPSGVALPVGGPVGIFSVKDNDNLVGLNDEPHKLKEEVKHKLRSSLREARTKLKKDQ